MTDNIDFSTMEERNEQTLSDIKNLQQIEQELYNSLETNANNNTLTEDQKNKIINKISEISQMRINLYANLKDTYQFFQKNVSTSRVTLDEQIVALDIVENELNEAKIRLQLMEDAKYNKLRQVEINTYYGKKYHSHTDVMKIIVIMCVPLLIIGVLTNMSLIPQRISMALMVLIISIGVIAVGYKMVDNAKRDNMNYDEYDWGFNENDAPSDNTGNVTDPWVLPSLECVGPSCCVEGVSTYDPHQNKCIPNIIFNSNAYQMKTTGSTSTYAKQSNTNSSGNDLSGMPLKTNDASGCQAECTKKTDCGGFTFNTARECYLKDTTISTQPTYGLSGTDLYIKSVNTPSLTTESFTNNNGSKLNYSMY